MTRQSMYGSAGNSSSSHLSAPFGISLSRSSTPSGFFERHNIFFRNRPRTTPTNPAASASSTSLRLNSPPTAAELTSTTDSRRSAPRTASSAIRQRFAQQPSSSTSQLPLDAPSSSPNASPRGLFGFPSRPSQGLRSPFDESSEELQDPSHAHLAMPPMTRTSSSGPGSGPGSAFGRMFRRYSQGQTRTLSNATDASAPHVGRSAAADQETSQSRSASAHGGRRTTNQGAPTLDNPVSFRSETLPAAIAAASPAGLLASEASERGTADSASPSASAVAAPPGTGPSPQAGVHRIRLVPHLEATRSLHFEPIERDVREGASAVKIGRFTDRAPGAAAAAAEEAQYTTGPAGAGSSRGVLGAAPGNRGGAVPTSAGGGGRIDSARIAFKSKVVSRVHAEVWCESSGKFFIKDTSSSSGTFLNHIRLSAPNVESKPFSIKDGDILQLGVDYQGGAEEIYRCVKIRVELNRAWQREANQFNVNALRQLRALQGSPMATPAGKATAGAPALPTNRQSMNVTDCCICLFSVTVCQALFIAPCSHVFHYKCIRPMLNMHHPGFSCPLCRTFADLEADVEEDEAWQQALLKEAEAVEASKSQIRNGESEPPTASQEPEIESTAIGGSSSSGSAGIPSSSSAPLMASYLQRQLGDDRPGTAVGDESPHGSTGHHDYVDATMLGNASPDEEAEEVIDEQSPGVNRSASGSRRGHAHDIERISEEADRAASSDIQNRRVSAPIAISGPSRTDGTSASQSYGFSPLEEARTPVNQHVLSVLAEAPPPAPAAVRRIAQADGARATPSSNSEVMLSLGSSSGILAARPHQSSSLATPSSPNGSNFSDDASAAAFAASGGYHTPPAADENQEDYVSPSASGTSVRRHSGITQVSGGASAAADGSAGSGHLPLPRRLAGNSGPASSSSNRASPTTAGGDGSDERHGHVTDEDGYAHRGSAYSADEAEGDDGESKLYHDSSSQDDDLAGSLDGADGQGAPAGSGLTPKGKNRRREGGSEGVGAFDRSSSPRRSSSSPRQQDASAMGAGAGGPGKVKMFFKKAAGAS